MECNAEDITSFLTFRHPLSALKRYKYPYSLSFEECDVDFGLAKEAVEMLLKSTVKTLLDKSERPAVMMSSGVDSVLLVALMKDLEPKKNIRLYTAMFDTDKEHMVAKERAKHFNLPHTVVKIEADDYLKAESYLKPLILQKGEPLHPNEIALAKTEGVAKKDGCDMIFGGEGADDIFGGYNNLLRFYKRYHLPIVSTGIATITGYMRSFLESYRYFSPEERNGIISPDYLTSDLHMTMSILLPDCEQMEIRNIIFYFIQSIHTPGLIKRGNNAIKFNGLEGAFPYMNDELATYVNSLPFEYKIFGSVSKYILRELALEFIPHDFAYVSKHPFPVPFSRWMEDTMTWNLNKKVFTTSNLHNLDGWHRWMVINLNTWIEEEQDGNI